MCAQRWALIRSSKTQRVLICLFCLFGLLALSLSSHIFAFSFKWRVKPLFRIAPYLVLTDDGKVILRFATNRKNLLRIESRFQTESGFLAGSATVQTSRRKVVSVPLGKRPCGASLSLSFLRGGSPVYRREYPGFSCVGAEPVSFGFISDTQGRRRRHRRLARVINNHSKDLSFLFHGGDIADWGRVGYHWRRFFKVFDSYATAPIIAARGNHAFTDFFFLRRSVSTDFNRYLRWSGTVEPMRFRFRTFDLLLLDTNWAHMTEDFITEGLRLLELKLAQGDKPVIVASHHSPLSSARRGSKRSRLVSRLLPMLEASARVKLFLGGHERLYERSFRNGIHYLNSGPAGGRHRHITKLQAHSRVVASRAQTFSRIEVGKEQIHLLSYNQDDHLFDELTIPIHDSSAGL